MTGDQLAVSRRPTFERGAVGPAISVDHSPAEVSDVVPCSIRRDKSARNHVGKVRSLADVPRVGATNLGRQPAFGDGVVKGLLQRADEVVESARTSWAVVVEAIGVEKQPDVIVDLRRPDIVRNENEHLCFQTTFPPRDIAPRRLASRQAIARPYDFVGSIAGSVVYSAVMSSNQTVPGPHICGATTIFSVPGGISTTPS